MPALRLEISLIVSTIHYKVGQETYLFSVLLFSVSTLWDLHYHINLRASTFYYLPYSIYLPVFTL